MDRSTNRGQSEVIGVVLLLSITVFAVTAIGATGAGVLGDAQSDSRVAQAENSMAQMSSKAGLVALGDSGTYTFDLGDLDDGTAEVREDAGRVTLKLDEEEIYSEQYGAVVATVGGTKIAYQGGGVWKKNGDGSVMVSPPEYHYQQRTLTFPIVRVTGTDRASGSVQGQLSKGESRSIYPNDTENRTNPLEDGILTVEIESEYYRGWHDFFDERTEGTVDIDHENRTVTAELAVPFEENIENVVAVSETVKRNTGERPTPHEEGVQYPSASPLVESKIEHCSNNGCEPIENGTITQDGDDIYYASGTDIPQELVIETNDNDVEVVIDGRFEPTDVNITGDGNVSFYISDRFELDGNSEVNHGGNASQLFVYLHSDATAGSQKGTPSFTGVLYAPGTDIDLKGDIDFKGALIANSVDIKGNAASFTYDEALSNIELNVTASPDTITYLHVTDNEIEIELR